MESQKDEAWKLLLDSLSKSTEEVYCLRQKEISLLQKLLDAEQTITSLISALAEEKYKPSGQVKEKEGENKNE